VRSAWLFRELLRTSLLWSWFLDWEFSEGSFDSRRVLHELPASAAVDRGGQGFSAEVRDLWRQQGWTRDEHFTEGGTHIESWARLRSFLSMGGADAVQGQAARSEDPGNPTISFHGEIRSKGAHRSTSDSESALHRKARGPQSRLCFGAHLRMANRRGFCAGFTVHDSITKPEPKVALRHLQAHAEVDARGDFMAQSPETLIYNGDGNLVRDGRWMYSWDAENWPVRVMSYGASDRAGWRRVDWAYDALGRRIRQTSYVLSNGVWVVTEDLKFVSDPVWFGRHLAELNATNHALVRSYVWGLDLSETLDSAGGVLWVRVTSGPASGTHFVTYDGNGNVWQLVCATTGTETARYEYGPLGEPLRATGPAAAFNPVRFSIKRMDPGMGLVLYEYRACRPGLVRWLSTDPLGELGFRTLRGATESGEDDVFADDGPNLYAYVRNDPAINLDPLGLARGIPPGQGISIPPSVPQSEELKHAVKRYNDACKCGDAPSDFDCHTICDAFYGNISTWLVARCMLSCGDCELGKFMRKNPAGGKNQKKPQPSKKK
jgi:RHS repeat-associated protein